MWPFRRRIKFKRERRRGEHARVELHGPSADDLAKTGRNAFGSIALLFTVLGITEAHAAESAQPPAVVTKAKSVANEGSELQLSNVTREEIFAALSLIAQLLAWLFPRLPRAGRKNPFQIKIQQLIAHATAPRTTSVDPREVFSWLKMGLKAIQDSAEYECARQSEQSIVNVAVAIVEHAQKRFARRKHVEINEIATALQSYLPAE